MSRQQNLIAAWLHYSRQVRWRLNFGWFWVYFEKPLLIFSILSALGLIGIRAQNIKIQLTLIIVWIISIILLATFWAYFNSKNHLHSTKECYSRLDELLNLNGQLLAATENKADFPDLPQKKIFPAHWRIARNLIPGIFSAILITTSLLWPFEHVESPRINEKPLAWETIQTTIDSLKTKKSIDIQSLEKFQQPLEELQKQPNENWYSHSSLETTDQLQQNLTSELAELKNNLDSTSSLLNEFAQNQNPPKASDLAPDSQNFSQENSPQTQELLNSLKKLTENNQSLELNKEFSNQLESLNANTLNQLTPEQIQQLQEQLNQNAQSLQKALEQMGQKTPDPNSFHGEMNGENSNENNNLDSAQVLGQNPSDEGASTTHQGEKSKLLPNAKPLSLPEANPKDLTLNAHQKTQPEKPKQDLSPQRQHSGGKLQHNEGGTADWKNSLHPDEQKALNNFYH